MCLLAVAQKRKLTREEVKNAFLANDDGAGIGWREGGMNHIRKGFMSLDKFLEFYKEFDALPHIVHFRLGTSGGRRPELTHPFVVSLTSPLVTEWSGKEPVLAHNGIVHGWEDTFLSFLPEIRRELRRKGGRGRLPEGPWSDTRAAAVMVALVGHPILQFFGGKWAVLERGQVKLYGDFVEDNGVYFSNLSYRVIRVQPQAQVTKAAFSRTPGRRTQARLFREVREDVMPEDLENEIPPGWRWEQ